MFDLSNAYVRYARFAKRAQPFVAPVAKVMRAGFGAIHEPVSKGWNTLRESIRRIPSVVADAARAVLRKIASAILRLLKALLKPALALGALVGMTVLYPPPDTQQTAAPVAPRAVEAVKRSVLPLPLRKPPVLLRKATPATRPMKAALASFHGNAQRFAREHDASVALADALNIPDEVVRRDVDKALTLADSNARAMKPRIGAFPLPAHISNRLLGVLTPADVRLLGGILKHARTLAPGDYTLTSALVSGDLNLEATITVQPPERSGRQCYRYGLTFIRRSFRHTMPVSACREGAAWTLSNPAPQRSKK